MEQISRLSRMNAPLIVSCKWSCSWCWVFFCWFCGYGNCVFKCYICLSLFKNRINSRRILYLLSSKNYWSRRYTELVLTNRVLSANEALDWGLINKVVDFKDLKDEAYNLAKKLAEGRL